MTVNDIHLKVIDGPNNELKNKKRQNNIDDIASQLFTGVDISSCLHKSVSSPSGCATIDRDENLCIYYRPLQLILKSFITE